jgi:cytochrome P450
MDRRMIEGEIMPAAHKPAFPPGPSSLFPTLVYRPGRNPLDFFGGLVKKYGPIVYLAAGTEHLYVVTEPRHIRDVLVTSQRKFKKGRGVEAIKPMLGQGLLTSEGQTHLRQRRLTQPAFHKERIAAYASVMTECAARVTASWTDGGAVDASEEMMRLTLAVVGKTLFGADVESQARVVGEALSTIMRSFWIRMLPFADVIERLPIPQLRRSTAARATLDRVVYGIIAERRRSTTDRGDLLSMLLLARDEEQDGSGMNDKQIRDEAMTIFLAGHETTANALSWTWYLVSQSPEIEARLHQEVDRVLGGRRPTVADIPSLTFVENVVTEAMRLYPPAYIVGRRALESHRLDDYEIPAGSLVVMSPYLTHRQPAYFPDPERFLPDRWTPAFKAALPPFAYFPFGGGARRCIGESFAWMELVLVVSTIAQQWRLRVRPGYVPVPQPLVTLRLKHGLPITVHRRS